MSNIYTIYKKSDRSITGFVWDDGSHHVFDEADDYALSTNTINWTEEKTVGEFTLLKTFEDVESTVATFLSVDSEGILTKVG